MSSSICYSPVTKQRISRWLVDAITLAYSSSGCSAPSESEPTPPEASPRLGHGPAGCPCQTFVRRPAGPPIHICKVLQPGCPRLAGQSPFCLSSNLSGSLEQQCSSPSFAWSVHNYMNARYHLRDDTQVTEDPQGSPCAWCILRTPLGLTPM